MFLNVCNIAHGSEKCVQTRVQRLIDIRAEGEENAMLFIAEELNGQRASERLCKESSLG